MRKADSSEFFARKDASGQVLEEKRSILAEYPHRHLVVSHEAAPLVKGLAAQLIEWQVLDKGMNLPAIAEQIEPDLIILDQVSQKLVAAAVCFPSSWNPTHWLDHPIQDIHEVVPQLNASIGKMIRKFLTELKPGKSFQRANWSFTRTAELNYHPDLERERVDDSIQLEEIHLRIEHQLFTAIESAVVMGIRIQPIPILSLRQDEHLWQNLTRILETMPEDVARYKSLYQGQVALVELMRSH